MKLKKGDAVILILLIVAALGWFIKDFIWPDNIDKHAVIKVDSQIYDTLSLNNSNEHMEIPVNLPENNYVHIVMEKDKIWVEDASCPDKVCVKTGIITKSGQSIVCLPNKTVVYIEGAGKTDIDDGAF